LKRIDPTQLRKSGTFCHRKPTRFERRFFSYIVQRLQKVQNRREKLSFQVDQEKGSDPSTLRCLASVKSNENLLKQLIGCFVIEDWDLDRWHRKLGDFGFMIGKDLHKFYRMGVNDEEKNSI